MIARLSLEPKWSKILGDILAQHVPELEVWAYGSRLGGTSHEGSDLDLVVIAPQGSPVSSVRLGALIDAFRESSLPIRVDIHDWARLPAAFRLEIQRSHQVVKPASGAVQIEV